MGGPEGTPARFQLHGYFFDGDGFAVQLTGDGHLVAGVIDNHFLVSEFVNGAFGGYENGGIAALDATGCTIGVINHLGVGGALGIYDGSFEIGSHRTQCSENEQRKYFFHN